VILIPIGQEDNVVRRTPWVSFGLIAANVAVFILLSAAGVPEEQVHERLQAFFKHLAGHPYLTPPADVSNRLGEGFTEALEKVRSEWEAEGGTRDPDATAAEQERLDALGRDALEALRARPAERFGYVPAAPRAAALISALFVHAGWLHILGNMLFLFVSGPFLEDKYGRVLFGGLYVLAGVAGNLAQGAPNPGSFVPIAGASGAIAGVMGAFLVRLGTARIRFLFIPILVAPMLRFRPLLPAFVVIPLWILEQLWYAQTAPDAGVAWWAHIGGFALGFAAALAVKLFGVEENLIHPGIERQISITQNPSLEAAMDARLRGDLPAARRQLRRALQDDPDNVDAWTESYETALLARDPAEVGRAGERLLSLHSRHGEGALAAELAHDKRWSELGQVPVRFRLALASWFERSGDARSALGQYAAVAEEAPQDPAALRALVRSGEILARGGDATRARELYARARAHPACSGAWPALIEKGLLALGPGR
jgi:membrane associated rhomboid family serine protease